jgi:hypothetical protein
VRGGKPIWSFEGETPLKFQFVDHDHWSGKTFYRLDAGGKAAGQLLSNPIFVVRKSSSNVGGGLGSIFF